MLPLLRKARVLVLDDDPAMQRLIGSILRRAGYRVEVVSSGQQAIERIGKTRYDALLLDLMTPTEGGITVVRDLKKSRPELLKRVLLVTGSPKSVQQTVAGDVAGVVQKPFVAEQLVRMVESVIQSR